MYENYLLHPGALSNLVANLPDFSDTEYSSDDIERYFVEHQVTWTDEDWLDTCDGANILNRLVKDLSENAYTYDKIRHGAAITQWLVENEPGQLDPVREQLHAILAKEVGAASTG